MSEGHKIISLGLGAEERWHCHQIFIDLLYSQHTLKIHNLPHKHNTDLHPAASAESQQLGYCLTVLVAERGGQHNVDIRVSVCLVCMCMSAVLLTAHMDWYMSIWMSHSTDITAYESVCYSVLIVKPDGK